MIPTEIRYGMISGVVGTLAFTGPHRCRVTIIRSDDAANNLFGRAFTIADDEIETATAGGTGHFAGLLVHPNAYQIEGLSIPNGTPGELCDMGEIFVEIAGVDDAAIGDPVFYDPATGALTLDSEGATPVPNCVIERHLPSPQTPHLAVVRLTN